jgi:protein-tyrosine-phosphatase
MKCSCCEKEIDPEFDSKCIPYGIDGDYVCSKKCKEKMNREFDAICKMTDEEFEKWMLG